MRPFPGIKSPITDFRTATTEMLRIADALMRIQQDLSALQGNTNNAGSTNSAPPLGVHTHASASQGGDSLSPVTLAVSGNATVGGTLGVTGATTLSSTLHGVGAVDFDSTLNVDGDATFNALVKIPAASADVTLPSDYLSLGNLVYLYARNKTSAPTQTGLYIYNPDNAKRTSLAFSNSSVYRAILRMDSGSAPGNLDLIPDASMALKLFGDVAAGGTVRTVYLYGNDGGSNVTHGYFRTATGTDTGMELGNFIVAASKRLELVADTSPNRVCVTNRLLRFGGGDATEYVDLWHRTSPENYMEVTGSATSGRKWRFQADILPYADNSFDLGSASLKWKDIYYYGTFSGGAVDGNLYPSITNTYDLGTPTYEWRHIYSSGTAYLTNLEVGANVVSGLIPSPTLTYNLGSDTYRWLGVYAQTLDITTGGTVTLASPVTMTGGLTLNCNVASHIKPSVTGTYDLGDSTTPLRFNKAHIAESIYIGTGTASGIAAIDIFDSAGDSWNYGINISLANANSASDVVGVYMSALNAGTGNVYGSYHLGQSIATTGTIVNSFSAYCAGGVSGNSLKTNVGGIKIDSQTVGGGAITNHYGVWINLFGNSAKGAISPTNAYSVYSTLAQRGTNRYGLYIAEAASTAGTLTNTYGAYISAPTAGTNKWALYCGNALVELDGTIQADGDIDHNGTNIGLWGVAPTTRPTAFTQTYATASKTHANITSSAVATTAATQTTPWGYDSAAQADAIPVAINAIRSDVENVKQVVNQIIDDLQSYGALQ